MAYRTPSLGQEALVDSRRCHLSLLPRRVVGLSRSPRNTSHTTLPLGLGCLPPHPLETAISIKAARVFRIPNTVFRHVGVVVYGN